MIGRGLFGKRLPWGNPADRVPQGFANSSLQEITIDPNWQSRDPMRQPGFWQGGDKFTGRDAVAGVLAVIGDGLSGWANGGGGAVQSLMASRMAPQRLAEEQRQRAAELADFEHRERFKASLAPPPAPDAFDRAMERAGIAKGTPEYAKLAREHALRTAQGQDETVVVPIPGRGTFVGPRSELGRAIGVGGGTQQPPETLPADFFKGGTAGNSGGNFHR
jgi:hypothetical protein